MSYIKRTNPSIKGMGCMWCGGAGDDFDSPAYGYSAVQSARDQAGIDYTAMGMPSQTQLLAASSNGAIAPLTTPTTTNTPYTAVGGYPSSIQTSLGQQGSTASVIAAQSADAPNPTALTVLQSFTSAVEGSSQPGVVQLSPNQTANTLSFVNPPVAAVSTCPITDWINTVNPWMLAGAVFAIAYLASQKGGKLGSIL